ncbi:MAG: helix-turn-helix domain-containing protein [Oscillospiraceae bacterium]
MLNTRLRELISDLGLSQRQFAKRINIDPGYLSRILQGKVTPPDRILLLIENMFNVSKQWLEEGKGEMYSNSSMSMAKRHVLEMVDTLNDEQVDAVSAFLEFLKKDNEKK